MQIPIINGVYTDTQANYRIAYPRNLVPVPKQTGVSEGYLRIAEGITELTQAGAVSGVDRGAFNWNGTAYRVIGASLIRVDAAGNVTVLGAVANDGLQVAFDVSYDYLVIGSGGNLYYYTPQGVISASAVSPASGGNGYAASDTVLLTNDVQLTINTVDSSGAVLTATITQGGFQVGGTIPSNPVGQSATSGVGVGATFNLTWTPLAAGVIQVTTPALGAVVDALWFEGYTVTTDGTYIVVTDLNDPLYVNPLKYGSTESDPSSIMGLMKYRNELYVCTRYAIAVFDNVGGANFPFSEQLGAVVEKGILSRSLKCKIAQRIAFVGSGRNEPLSVFFTFSGLAQKIATQEIEELLRAYTEDVLATCILEAREDRVHQHLYLHLPDQTLVYDVAASEVLQQPIWFVLSSTTSTYGAYRARNFVWCYNKWLCGDLFDSRIGYLDRTVATQYGDQVGHQFDVPLLYNEAKGALIQRLELVGLTGLAPLGTSPTMSLSFTRDGKTYSNERFVRMGRVGEYQKRLIWLNALFMRQVASLRFRGVTPALVSYTRVEASVEGLAN